MTTRIAEVPVEHNSQLAVNARAGFWAAWMLAGLAVVAFAIGIVTPPRSGPWCTANCEAYPYSGAASFFPRDYWWMFPAMLLAPLLMAVSACVHFCIPPARRLWSLLALCCATSATALLLLDYVSQFLAVQPSLASHQPDGVALLTQYNPHGLFLVMEDLGYLLMATALLLLAMALAPASVPAKAARRTMASVGSLTFIAFVFMAVGFGTDMALPFELTVISIVWIGLIPIGILLALWFRRLPFGR